MKTYSTNFLKFFNADRDIPRIPLRQTLTLPFIPEPYLIPEDCAGYAIYSQEMVCGDGVFYKNEPKLISIVFFGELWDVNRVIKEHGGKSNIVKEMLNNNIKYVVKTRCGIYRIEHKEITKIIYEKS